MTPSFLCCANHASDSRAGTMVAATAGSGGRLHGLVRPNLSADEAQRLADRALADLRRHEWAAHVTMPGELLLTARSRVSLQDAGAGWDRVLAVSDISRHLDARRGFSQRVTLHVAIAVWDWPRRKLPLTRSERTAARPRRS